MSTQADHEILSQFALPLVPPLENGDHLSREEFERRWESMPGLKNAELIEGVVLMAAAVRYRFHGRPHARLAAWLVIYADETPGVEGADNASVRLDETNMPQPDLLLRIDEKCDGQSTETGDGHLQGAPELIAEIAASSASYDLHEKRAVYLRCGVREYLVWRVLDRQFDWFVLREGSYAQLTAGQDGILRSETFPGLWLDAAALLRGDGRGLRRTLERGIASPQHAEFVAQLQRSKKET
jgi:Uma2 family endonuclease